MKRDAAPSAGEDKPAMMRISDRRRDIAMWSAMALNGIGMTGALVVRALGNERSAGLSGSDFLTLFSIFGAGAICAGGMSAFAWLSSVLPVRDRQPVLAIRLALFLCEAAALAAAYALNLAGLGVIAIIVSQTK